MVSQFACRGSPQGLEESDTRQQMPLRLLALVCKFYLSGKESPCLGSSVFRNSLNLQII
jgi:hypothetical protein